MTTYARLDVQGQFQSLVELTAEQYAALQANGKAVWLRLWVVDPLPTPSPTQAIAIGPITINATEARQTWTLRNKTQEELDAEQNTSEVPTLKALVAALTTDIAAYNPNPDMTGTVAVQLANLWAHVKDLQRQQRRDNVILRHYVRGLR